MGEGEGALVVGARVGHKWHTLMQKKRIMHGPTSTTLHRYGTTVFQKDYVFYRLFLL